MNKKILPLFLLAATAFIAGCSDSDDTTAEEAVIGTTPQESVIGTWYNNLNAFSQEDTTLSYLSFNADGKGIYATSSPLSDIEYDSFNYTYDKETGEGTIQILNDPEMKFAASDNCIAMLDENDSLGLFSKYSDDTKSWYDVLVGNAERNEAKSDIPAWVGPSSYNSDIVVDISDIKPTPESSAAKTRADAAASGLPSWMSSFLGGVAQILMNYGQNYIANTFYEKGDESMFCWFTDSEKLNRIYRKIYGIELSQESFRQALGGGFNDRVYSDMCSKFYDWHSNIQDIMGHIDSLALADSVKSLSVAKEWVQKDPTNPYKFISFLQQIVAKNYPYIITEDSQSQLKKCDYIDFIGQLSLTNYVWKQDMFDYFLAYMSVLQQMISSGSILTTMYYTYIDPNQRQMDDLRAAHQAFENHLAQVIRKIKPDSSEVECLLPHCHFTMRREIPLHNYANIIPKGQPYTVKDLYSYEYLSPTVLVTCSSNLAWSLALDKNSYYTELKDTLNNMRDALMSRSEVNTILNAYKGNEEYKDSLIKILLKSARMTFASKEPVDTTKLCLFTKTDHGYESTGKENIPLILPNENAFMSSMMSGGGVQAAPSTKISKELGGYTQNLFALTGYKDNGEGAKAYKIGTLNVEHKKTGKWYTLWIHLIDSYKVTGISDLTNQYWLAPYVKKRINKSAAWNY